MGNTLMLIYGLILLRWTKWDRPEIGFVDLAGSIDVFGKRLGT